MMQVLISETSREVSRSYAVDGRSRRPERLKHDEPHRPRRGIERDPNRKGKKWPVSRLSFSLLWVLCDRSGSSELHRGGPREGPIVGHPSTIAPRPSTAELLPASKTRLGPRRRKSPRSAESPGTRAASSSGMVAAILIGWGRSGPG